MGNCWDLVGDQGTSHSLPFVPRAKRRVADRFVFFLSFVRPGLRRLDWEPSTLSWPRPFSLPSFLLVSIHASSHLLSSQQRRLSPAPRLDTQTPLSTTRIPTHFYQPLPSNSNSINITELTRSSTSESTWVDPTWRERGDRETNNNETTYGRDGEKRERERAWAEGRED